MKKQIYLLMLVLINSSAVFAQDPGWPRQLTNNGSVLILYTPQVADWEQYQSIDFRMAFSLTPYQAKQVVGVVYINATTNVDTYNHMVSIYNMNITDVHFPGMDDATSASLGQTVRIFLDVTKTVNVSMERIVACTPKKQDATKAVNVKNDPPTIFVSNTPAIILQLEGQPAITDAKKGGIQYVFNANWPLFFDKSASKYYLFDDQEWQTAGGLNGPWTFTSKLPSSLTSLAKDENWKTVLKSAIPAPTKASSSLPKIYYSENPAEIILFQGAPVFTLINGTSLKYATNTNNSIFYSNTTSQYYYLAAGRWFSAPGLNGPWVYATPNLPADFANIPVSSPASRVLASVPGTDEAADAVMIAQIPTKTSIDPKDAPQVTITYSGTPKFVTIEGTSLSYVVNTTEKVIMVSDNQYYACVSGLWYVATTPDGPWVLASSVPQVIYTIPSSSPVYNVTYVTQTVNTNGTVEASYTAGYMGAFVVGVGVGVIIASGTGYYYPPYMYYPPVGFPVCYAYPMPYGAYAYHPYGYYGGVSYHASYNPYTGTYARSATAYGPYGSASVGHAYNPYTGTMARGASVSTPYGTRSAGQAYNPYTGASAATRQGSGAYGQAGTSVYNNGHGTTTQTAHATNNYGQTVAGARNTNGAAAIGASGPNSNGGVAKSANGDMYAAKDGNVYKNTGDGWSQASNTKPSSTSQYSTQSSAIKSQNNGSFSKSGGGSAPTSEMSGAAADRQRGNTGASQWGGGGGFGGGNHGGSFGGGGGGWGGGGGGGFGRGRR
ncbi:MAG TPA: hypothetical protein VGZ90_14195 [Puia sp.]|nr:hypothetical protein [Puia sp.]